jgi:UDP-N-acetyl-D-glucosamine/UDP-N-acetyl-D-galactosamine dehydrogenase
LESYGVEVFVTDPTADPEEAMHEYGVRLMGYEDLPRADAIVAAVAHREYAALPVTDFARKLVAGGAFVDVKASYDPGALQAAGLKVWRL